MAHMYLPLKTIVCLVHTVSFSTFKYDICVSIYVCFLLVVLVHICIYSRDTCYYRLSK